MAEEALHLFECILGTLSAKLLAVNNEFGLLEIRKRCGTVRARLMLVQDRLPELHDMR